MAQGQVTPARFAAVLGLPLGSLGRPEDALDPYAQCLADYRVQVAQGLALLRAQGGSAARRD